MKHTFEIEEEDRQLIILSLAELSIQRPGWVYALGRIANYLDGQPDQDAQNGMFDRFRRNHSNGLAEKLSRDPIAPDDSIGYPTQTFS